MELFICFFDVCFKVKELNLSPLYRVTSGNVNSVLLISWVNLIVNV